ncbi:hypothetical protein KCU81_g7118, partial [Aureobasidium melanogenum]|uniref:Uncharacterized protein n=1 Tax=Aureobasidium melanogenum (strain CBS 110374) TaxID=1043003 RepID=A0A074VQB2_AURM1
MQSKERGRRDGSLRHQKSITIGDALLRASEPSLSFFLHPLHVKFAPNMDDQVIAPTGADQNNGLVTTTATTTSTSTTTQLRRSQRLIENQNQNGQTATTGPPRATRAPRPIDPVQRRKKAWPQLWEPWRIEAIATYLQMSGPEAVERLRTTLDELWKTDPQQASVYEDALPVYDARVRAAKPNAVAAPEAGPSSQNNDTAAPEAEETDSESTISAHGTQITFNDRPVASADHEAALTLMSLRSAGNTQDYIGYGASERLKGLQPFNPVDAPTTTSKILPLDGIFETNVTGEGVLPPVRTQTPDVPGVSTRGKGKQPATYSTLTTSPKNDDPTLKNANNISKALSEVSRFVKPLTRSTKPTGNVIPITCKPRSSRTYIIDKDAIKIVETPTILRRSKRKITHDSENEDTVVDLTGHDRPASPKKPKASCKKGETVEESSMLLRSKRKVIHVEEVKNDNPSSPEENTEKSTKSPDKQVTQQRTLRRRSARKIVYDSDDEAEAFSTNIKSTAGSQKVKKEEAEEKSPVLRRTKRKLTRVIEDEDDDFPLPDDDLPTPKRSKKAVKKVTKDLADEEDFDDSSPEDVRPTPKNSWKAINKSNETSIDEDEDDNDDDEDEEEGAPVKKRKQATKKATSTLVHPPANLPLKAPANHPDIPDGALALNEHFKKNTPRPLGVQLPINRNRTRWEWIPYNTRKVANANFDWADDQQRKDANRFRQQRIRRRLTEHGYIHDGRKNH